jgi:cell division inhibitor SulA
MNLIEGKVEWCGNGVVLMRERSVMQSVFQFCKQRERQLYSMVQCSVTLSKSLFNIRLPHINRLKAKHPSDARSQQSPPLKQPAQTLKQPAAPKLVTTDTTAQQPRPMGTLTEIRRYVGTGQTCIASGDEHNGLQQLLPALAGFCRDRWLVLVSPPQRPDVAELTAAGIDPSRILLVHASDANGLNSNGLKVVEQALKSGTCGAVVAWLEECDAFALKRLRRAAVAGHAWGVMLREGEKEATQLEMVMS